MANTTKQMSNRDSEQVLKKAYNEVDDSLSVNGFLVAKVGRKVEISTVSEVETYTFSENGSTLYVLTLTYADDTLATLVSAERTA